MNFVKMHSLGNDFVICELRDFEELAIRLINDPSNYSNNISQERDKLVRAITNRNTGIGCDQLILFSSMGGDMFEMQIFNNNGSKANACGNASRCLARFLFEEDTGKNSKVINIIVNDRVINCLREGNNISVNMGKCSFSESWIPNKDEIVSLSKKYRLNINDLICVDMGNPHLIVLSNTLSLEDQNFLGQKLSTDEIFKNEVNVNFVRITNNQITLQVYERGTGFTLACGTGACATFAALKSIGVIEGESSDINFALGVLKIAAENEDIIMSGSAIKVAKGEYYYSKGI